MSEWGLTDAVTGKPLDFAALKYEAAERTKAERAKAEAFHQGAKAFARNYDPPRPSPAETQHLADDAFLARIFRRILAVPGSYIGAAGWLLIEEWSIDLNNLEPYERDALRRALDAP